jgi:hypothetical protein
MRELKIDLDPATAKVELAIRCYDDGTEGDELCVNWPGLSVSFWALPDEIKQALCERWNTTSR